MSIPGKPESRFSIPGNYLLPQEEMLETGKKHSRLSIGIPKENQKNESRVSLTPEAVEILTGNGHEVFLEKGAGKAANYSDNDYSEKGGIILDNKAEVFQSDILKDLYPNEMGRNKV